MVRKPKTPEAEKFPRKAIPCESGPSAEEQGRAYAKLVTAPDVCGYRVILASSPKGLAEEIDAPTFLATLREQAAAVQEGDMSHAEAMLITQATALQSLFVRLAERGLSQEHMPNLEGFMRLALRAQSQCRATLETLAAIKNPPIVRQAGQPDERAATDQQWRGGTLASAGNRSRANPTIRRIL
ncbi:MAG: hypothetical protein IPH41_18650 [Sulfuritalea sp.]|nr:hypothetical protein [Sulfuritalea sp.]